MGILSRLRPKEETTHFERDEAGRVTSVTRNGEEHEPGMKSSKQLMKEYRETHPKQRFTERPGVKRVGAGLKRIDAGIVKYNRERNIMRPGASMPRQKASDYGIGGNYNPFGSMFDTGMNYKKPRTKSSSKTKYKAIGGKAYPIAGTGKKKKKSTKRKSVGGYDMMDNWGFL